MSEKVVEGKIIAEETAAEEVAAKILREQKLLSGRLKIKEEKSEEGKLAVASALPLLQLPAAL